MPRARRAPVALLLVALVTAPGACGDDDSGNRTDGGQPGVHRLDILAPPGRSLGLAPGEAVLLRVRYLDPEDRPEADAQVDFAIQGSAEGATLSGYHSYTDEAGAAEMLLTAAGAPARFSVVVTAPQALGVTFEVAVSEVGFSSIEVQPGYRGDYSVANLVGLRAELRFETTCSAVSPLAETPADRVRQLDGFGDLALFENIPMDVGYAVSLRALDAEDETLAWGCMDLYAGQLVRGATMRLYLVARDLIPSAAGRYSVLSTLALPSGSHAQLRSYFTAYAPTGECPYAVEQLLVDCLLDAAFPDGSANCMMGSTDPDALALDAERGTRDALGCRGAETSLGQPSLEAEMSQSVDATGLARRAALADFMATTIEDLTALEVRSELRVVEIPESGNVYSWHRLQSLRYPGIAPTRWIPLADLGATPTAVSSLPSSVSVGPPPVVTLSPHGLSLQAGWGALHAAWLEHLQGQGLPRNPRLAWPLLVDGYLGPPSDPTASGCDAVVSRLCEALGEPPTCLPQACEEGLLLLDTLVAAFWDALPSPVGPDAMFATSAVLVDTDGDLHADRLGTPESPSHWLLTLHFNGQWLAPASATYDATRLAVP